MKTIFMCLMCTATLLFCPSVKANDNLTADNVKFLKSCNIEQEDINVIPNLPPDGKDRIDLVLESSRKNCNMDAIKSFKATREFLKKFTPPPKTSPMPPRGYSHDFLTKEESKYIDDVNKKILDKVFEDFNKR